MHICTHASGGRVGCNVPPAGLKLLEVTIDLSVVDVTIYPPGRNPLGGWGDWRDQTIYVTTYLYVYVYVHPYVPMLIISYLSCVTFGNINIWSFFELYLSIP